jgi:alpha-methylacyl-CoA racemase
MLLADLGADVVRVTRPPEPSPVGAVNDPTLRGRTLVVCDLRTDEGRELVRRLAERAEVLIEGYRPGVMERLGLGPDELLERNPKLVYGRMTGYGQEGPLASAAGHDINYISIAGVLGALSREGERPVFPLNLVGDYGGGGMLLAFGIVCGVLEARRSGRGQVVDAAMVDGASLLTTIFHGLRADGVWSDEPGTNFLDGGAHFYEVYETADGGYMAVGAIEPQFYSELLRRLDLPSDACPQWDRARWPELKERFAQRFRTRTRAEWSTVFEHADACVTPVLGLSEAVQHPHNVARGAFTELGGAEVPTPAPRFSATPAACRRSCAIAAEEALAGWAGAVAAA